MYYNNIGIFQKGDNMDRKLSPGAAYLKAQMDEINTLGISPDKFAGVIDDIINGDLADKNYKRSGVSLAKATDKEKEIDRILNNYDLALATVDKESKKGKQDTNMMLLKISIIVGAATAGLSALGMDGDDINDVLGLPQTGEE